MVGGDEEISVGQGARRTGKYDTLKIGSHASDCQNWKGFSGTLRPVGLEAET